MKRFYSIVATAIAALSLTSSADVFIIERTNGEKLELNVETIKEMRFKSEDEDTGNLAPESVEIVDLGLSVCWASHNIGASKPNEVGEYVMWGCTEPSNWYSWSYYPYGNAQGLTKYSSADGLIYLQSEDDFASSQWGSDWRMPTQEEAQELIDNCEIDMEAEEDGVPGVRIISKVPGYEGNSIFFPLNGYMQDDNKLFDESVYLWTNTVARGFYQFAVTMRFSPTGDYADYKGVVGQYRYLGENVRAVYTKKESENPPVVADDSVDLGLSVNWASYNVGASAETETGIYVAWGETEPKEDYNWSTYSFGTSATAVTKYCKTDKINVLEPSDDAATMILGKEWRTPTDEEMTELIQNCTVSADNVNGVSGIRFTSKVEGYEGKSIFFPVTGEMQGNGVSNGTAYVDMWTSTLAGTSLLAQGKAYGLNVSILNPGDAKVSSADRCYGRPVRGVKAK